MKSTCEMKDCDLVIINAKVWTGDDKHPSATAFLVRGGIFMTVGSDSEVKAAAHPHAHVINAHAGRIVPGLIDAHLHLLDGGFQLSRLSLREVPDRAAFLKAIADRAATTPVNQWILGGRWSTESWPDPTQPTKDWIDPLTPNNPTLLSRMDGHEALANSVALRLAGIDRNGPPDPVNGKIERHPETNEPTGILKESAVELVRDKIPPQTPEEQDAALAAAMHEANSHGLTCVHTMSQWKDVTAFDRARAAGLLTLRIREYINEHDWSLLDTQQVGSFRNDDWIRIVGYKFFADGSLGSRTAYMAAPYSDNPPSKRDWCGLPNTIKLSPNTLMPLSELGGYFYYMFFDKLHPAIHAIGDQANHLILDACEFAFNYVAKSDPEGFKKITHQNPFRIEHAQHLLPTDIPRFAKLGVVASMQPYHKADDGRYAEKAIGPERCKTSYAFRSLLDSGAHLAFGSDWPVVMLDPFHGVWAAVTGLTLDGKPFVPEQNITVEEALRCYTRGSAYAAGDEDRLGLIAPGSIADFVILEDDPFTIAPDKLKDIRVKATFVTGKEVYRNSKSR